MGEKEGKGKTTKKKAELREIKRPNFVHLLNSKSQCRSLSFNLFMFSHHIESIKKG